MSSPSLGASLLGPDAVILHPDDIRKQRAAKRTASRLRKRLLRRAAGYTPVEIAPWSGESWSNSG